MRISHKAMILNALKRGERLTRLDCLTRFGCFEAGARITELRREGYNIPPTEMHYENGHRFGVWHMEIDKQ